MAYLKLLISLCAFCSFSAFAGYAQVAPPPNWTQSAGTQFYKAAVNDASFANGVRGAAGVVNVGGRAVTMPAAYRFAANAGRVAAGAAFGNPALFAAVLAGSALYAWYNDSGYSLVNGVWKKLDPNACVNGPCTQYRYVGSGVYGPWQNTYTTACNAYAAAMTVASAQYLYANTSDAGSSQCYLTITYKSNGSVFGRYSYGNAQTQSIPTSPSPYLPATQTEFEDGLANKPIPAGLPQLLPVPLPVELPILNPSADPVPVPQPMRVPMGEPVPVPNTNPQQWKTPVVDLVPSPTVSEPWRVDLQPKDITKTDATPLPSAAPVPVTPPEGQTEAEKDPDLCEKNPDILACQKLDEPENPELETQDKDIAITPQSGWGGGGASCPAPRYLPGAKIEIPFTTICNFMDGIRPIIIAVAWLSAAFILLGVKGGES